MSPTNSNILLFQHSNGGRLKISNQALEQMLLLRQLNPIDCEAGGVLLGRLLIDSHDIIVDEITVPMLMDKRSRVTFYRHKYGHQSIIDRRWQESGGTCTYLGEWHTHPEPIPTPSIIDLTDWKRKLNVDSFDKTLHFLIIGTVEARMWFGEKPSKRVRSMESILASFNVKEDSHEC